MSLIAGALLVLAASTTGTGALPAEQQAPAAKKPDSDPMICQRVQEIGSLLKNHRVCMRRSEWADQRRSDKDMIDHAQVQRRMDGGN